MVTNSNIFILESPILSIRKARECAEKQGENTVDKKDQESSIVTEEDSIRDVLLTWDEEE